METNQAIPLPLPLLLPLPITIPANGISICYEEFGKPTDPAVLLIMGLACQLTAWSLTLVNALVEKGFRVIRFDNRDIGLSTEMKLGAQVNMPATFLRYKLGRPIASPYDLHDMSDDAAALLDALDIASAHVVGVSMGGMIGQILAVRHANRVKSLSLLMSSDNSPWNPAPDPRVLWRLNGGGIKGHHLEAARARSLAFWKVVKSPLYPIEERAMLERLEANYHRSYRPAGVLRQMRAIMATGSLAGLGPKIRIPVKVVHGDADLLVRPLAAKKLAARIPEARLEIINGMGHDLPEQLVPRYVELITRTIERAE